MSYEVTIIIPVKDDLLLETALQSIKQSVEVIVSLNCPSDKVREMCKTWKKKGTSFDLRIIETSKLGMSAALNHAVRKATYSKIIVLDSDCRLDLDTIDHYSKSLDKFCFVRGTAKIVKQKGIWYEQTRLEVESVNEIMKKDPRLYGPAIAFIKEDYLKLGGYDEDILYGCDHKFDDIVRKCGYIVGYCEQAVIWHAPISYGTDKKSHIGYGRGNRIVDNKSGYYDGLKYIFSKISLQTMVDKWTSRGFWGVIRTWMQFIWMLRGYSMR